MCMCMMLAVSYPRSIVVYEEHNGYVGMKWFKCRLSLQEAVWKNCMNYVDLLPWI